MQSCIDCGRGFCSLCPKCKGPKKRCHIQPKPVAAKSRTQTKPAKSTTSKPTLNKKEPLVLQGRGRPLKNTEDMVDALSTGRKRAAILYPIYRDLDCEWKMKKNCGGGKEPITGCVNGKQAHRHHGPVKDTNRNEQGNVHRICVSCHNRWHALNDEHYDEKEFMILTHNPSEATEEEILSAEAWWRLKGRVLLSETRVKSDE